MRETRLKWAQSAPFDKGVHKEDSPAREMKIMLMYKTIKFVDRVTDYILLLLFLLLFLIGFYTVYDTLKIYEGALGNNLRSFRLVYV